MKKLNFAMLLSLLVIVLGCSQNGIVRFETIPAGNESLPADSGSSLDYQIINSGIMNLESGKVEPDEKSLCPYFNVTSYLGSNFSFHIENIIPPDALYITLKINNVTALTLYDVCIVFDELYGKTVTNPDSYMDIYQPYDIDPFIAFCKR